MFSLLVCRVQGGGGGRVPEVYSKAPPANPDRIESLWQLSSALLVHVADRLFCLRPPLWMTDSLGGFSLGFFLFKRSGAASSLCRSALCVIWREDKGPFCPGVGRVVCTCNDRQVFNLLWLFFFFRPQWGHYLCPSKHGCRWRSTFFVVAHPPALSNVKVTFILSLLTRVESSSQLSTCLSLGILSFAALKKKWQFLQQNRSYV